MVHLRVVYLVLTLVACGDNRLSSNRPDADIVAIDSHVDEDSGGGIGDSMGGTDAANDAMLDARPDGPPITYPMGALVGVTATSTVGVLLEDFPLASRARLATAFMALPQSYWIERAKQQIRLATYRLIYRGAFYPANSGRNALPLTEPEAWTITLAQGGPSRTTTFDNHDVVTWDFTFSTTILTDEDSPATTEPNLATIGGTHTESFVFPVDPTLLIQRTGYACMDEEDFPPQSVDEENAWEFYDDSCTAENPNNLACHQTLPLPTKSCDRAVRDTIGRVDVALDFERLAWDATVAAQVRRGPVTVQDAPDLVVVDTGRLSLSNNRIIYRYFQPNSCALVESCVGGAGWRRLLTFDSYDHNQGGEPIHIGPVDYAVQGFGSELIDHNVYVHSACHDHYHFEYYGNFSFGSGVSEINKNGFCLESTGRISNNELSPLHTPYDCYNQGVSAGWGDLYAAGLLCNWVDVTGVDTSTAPVTRQLTFASNPDGFICEGDLQKDSLGNQIWETTAFTTSTGEPVDRAACAEAPFTEENDIKSVAVTLPQKGGMLTQACTDGQTLGPARNCGFAAQPNVVACTAGAAVTLSCSGGSVTQPQVVRVCETSRALGGGVDCVHRDALSNTVLEGLPALITTTCPAARDATEIGGQVAIYTAPAYGPDGAVPVTCTVL